MFELEKILGELTIILQTKDYTSLKDVHKKLSDYVYKHSPEDIKQYSWTTDRWSK